MKRTPRYAFSLNKYVELFRLVLEGNLLLLYYKTKHMDDI